MQKNKKKDKDKDGTSVPAAETKLPGIPADISALALEPWDEDQPKALENSSYMS